MGSRSFKLRLMEMLAVACHDLAALLHEEHGEGFHRGAHAWRLNSAPEPPPTVFYHFCYRNVGQYPRGVADIVGYWAEARLFGGVVVFDRGEDETGVRSFAPLSSVALTSSRG